MATITVVSNELYNLEPSSRVSMDMFANEPADKKASRMLKSFQDDIFYWRMKQKAWDSYCNSNTIDNGNITPAELKTKLNKVMDENGNKEVLISSVGRTYEKLRAQSTYLSSVNREPVTARRSVDEKNDTIREVRNVWEKGINEELLAIGAEMRRSFVVCRPNGIACPLLEESLTQSARDTVRFLYDSEDLYETCVNIKNANSNGSSSPANAVFTAHTLNTIKMRIRPYGFDEVVRRYRELSVAHMQMGLDETNFVPGTKFAVQRHEEGMNLLKLFNMTGLQGTQGASGTAAAQAAAAQAAGSGIADTNFPNMLLARQYLRRGCPPSLRARMWRAAFGLPSEPSKEETQRYGNLRSQCDRYDMLTDELLIHDVGNVADDLRYFVFEDTLKSALLCFARDDSIRFRADYEVHKPLLGYASAEQSKDSSSPPCAVQPFLGLAAYAAPLCYVFEPVSLQSVLAAAYCRIWCRLNVLTSDHHTLLQVCASFEHLLIHANHKLYLHLCKIGLKPLHVALPWIQLGFVGLLEVDQVLCLWDRMFGYMDATLLAVFAVAVFLFRAVPLFQCTSQAEAQLVLAEGLTLKVVPLLQMYLFSDVSSSYFTATPAHATNAAKAAT